jgi:hypothetical protein
MYNTSEFNTSELTVINNAAGEPTALGYPLVRGGGRTNKKTSSPYDNLAIPAGLVCRTETICSRPEQSIYNNEFAEDIIPDSLYDRLLALAETKPAKPMTRRKAQGKNKAKTQKRKGTRRSKK